MAKLRFRGAAGMRIWAVLIAGVGAVPCGRAQTAPAGFVYEGAVAHGAETAASGKQRLTFSVFRGGTAEAADSGLLLYGETVETEIAGGRVVHAVGSGTPTFGSLTAATYRDSGDDGGSGELWLQISVGDGQRPVLPRTKLATAACAGAAGDAQRLGGLPAEAYVLAADLTRSFRTAAAGAAATVKAAGTGYLSFIGGGQNQNAAGGMSAVAGGTDNNATWWAAFIGGGSFNWATGAYSAVAGGLSNAAIHDRSFVGGGGLNRAEGFGSTVAGGSNNKASGANATVPGGQLNKASGPWSFAAGRRADAAAQGAFVWADSEDADHTVTDPDTFSVRARNGALFQANGNSAGVMGTNTGDGPGIEGSCSAGIAGFFHSTSGRGVYGVSQSDVGGMFESASTNAVFARTSGGGIPAITGQGNGTSGIGVAGSANNGSRPVGIWGHSTVGYAGDFSGRVNVSGNLSVAGTLSKGAGSFKIDHPQDPENKYLYHSFVESPDMMNVYNGNCVLDGDGGATVELPGYFASLNRDFRYQLTALKAPGPSLHVSELIENNSFGIAGGQPGMTVSWQVTGIRKDAFADANRIPVEVDKPAAERGAYLHHEAFGQPASKALPSIRENLKAAAALSLRD